MRLLVDYSKKLHSLGSVFITFPFRQLYVDLVKSMETKVYYPNEKRWEIPLDDAPKFIELLEDHNIEFNRKEYKESLELFYNDQNAVIQKVEHNLDTTVLNRVDFKTKPRDYQKQGIVFGLRNKKCLNADEPGLGKTLQSVNIARLKKNGQHCLVICGYATLQYNWKAEVEKHTNEKAYILGMRTKPRNKRRYIGTKEDKYYDLTHLNDIPEFFIITNMTFVREAIMSKYKDKNGKERKSYNYFVAKTINRLCKEKKIGRIILDEAQVIKNMTSNQTNAMLEITDCEYKNALTGTPLMNDHSDLYPILKWLDATEMNYYGFLNKFCIMGGYKNSKIVGNKNNKYLNTMLSNVMIRRKKNEVLDLPPKIYTNDILVMDMLQDNLYNKVKRMLKSDLIKHKGNKLEILKTISSLRKITCHPLWYDPNGIDVSVKFDKVYELVSDLVANNEKTLILSNWVTPYYDLGDYSLQKLLKEFKPLSITGDDNQEQRENRMNLFQNNPDYKVLYGTYGAMGVGLTLTSANNVILLDQAWNKATEEQGIDRTYRIGTKKTVTVHRLICLDTIDEWVAKKVEEKGQVSAQTVDDKDIDELIDNYF